MAECTMVASDSASATTTSTSLGSDVLLCEISKYLDPLEYSTISRYFLHVAEHRAEEFLKKIEQRCFDSAPSSSSSSSSSLVSLSSFSSSSVLTPEKKWRLRLSLSVLERYRSFYNNDNYKQRKRKQIVSMPMLGPNIKSPRLLWNHASRVPLTVTKRFLNGPNVLLPDGYHIAFFCDVYHQLIIVDGRQSQMPIVHVEEATTTGIPDAAETSIHRDDLQLFCSDDGHLMLYYHRSCCPSTVLGENTNDIEVAGNTTNINTCLTSSCHGNDAIECTCSDNTSNMYTVDLAVSNPACWVSVWKIPPNSLCSSRSNSTPTKNPTKIEHVYFKTLDFSDVENTHGITDTVDVSPVQDMTFCSSSGIVFLIRYLSNLSSPHSTASSSSSGLFYRIQSFHISNGILLNERDVSVFPTAPQQVHYSPNPVDKIEGSTLTIVSGGEDRHLLLSLRCSSPNSNSTAIDHYTFNKDNLNLVDFLKPSTSRFVSNDDDSDDTNINEEDDEYFVQHVDHRILYCRRSRRDVDIDPIVQNQNHHQHTKTACNNFCSAFDQPSSYFSRTLAVAKTTKNVDFIGVVRVVENGTLHVQQEKEEQIILASSSSSFSCSNNNSNSNS
jgi:hypothetical protein